MGDKPISDTPIFLGGAPRSGLTLLGAMLGTHSRIFCGPDLNLIPTLSLQWTDFRDALGELHENHFDLPPGAVRENFAELITGLFEHAIRTSGKARVAEKSAINALVFGQLRELFPDSPRIHVLRDGRDVVSSLLQTGWTNPQTGEPLPHTVDASAAARYWVQFVETARAGPVSETQVIEVRYEDLATETSATLVRICNALDETFEPGMIGYGQRENRKNLPNHPSFHALKKKPHMKSIGAWRDRLDPGQQTRVKDIAGPTLIELGYCADLDW